MFRFFTRNRQISDKNAKKRSRYFFVGVAALLFTSGVYLLWLILAQPVYMPSAPKDWNEPVPQTARINDNRLYIPKLKLNLPYKSGDESVLDGSAWHRYPERGDPEKGGNFILAGHRLELGPTPGETSRRSPFYHIDNLIVGDEIYVDFNGIRYKYEVAERLRVQPSQVEIEAPSQQSKMTLYTCTLRGTADGREVIIARMMAQNVDPSLTF